MVSGRDGSRDTIAVVYFLRSLGITWILYSVWAGVCIDKCGIAGVIFQMAQGVQICVFCTSQFRIQRRWAAEICVTALSR